MQVHIGLSEPYTTLRGTREGCPAAPIKFNILHHVATMELRKKWSENQANHKVIIDTFPPAAFWPTSEGCSRTVVDKKCLTSECESNPLKIVGYADDTTIITRYSESEEKIKSTREVYKAWGHTIHPDKWQRLWASEGKPPKNRRVKKKQKPPITDIDKEAKVLGCFLEADGGYTRELNNRTAKASGVWQRLKKQIEKVNIGHKTKGRLLRASVVAAMLYGVETRAPEKKRVNKMQGLINGYERRLALGPSGGPRDMVGRDTQTDIKVTLGTISIQLEIDLRILRYIGHVSRLPSDRWEYRILFGRLRGSTAETKSKGKDQWWEHARKLIKEIMNTPTIRTNAEIESPWYELAQNRALWRNMLWKWKQHRTEIERNDTQQARESTWNKVAPLFNSSYILNKVWSRSKPIKTLGTSLEGYSQGWLRQVIIAGGVHADGWVSNVPDSWKEPFKEETNKNWI